MNILIESQSTWNVCISLVSKRCSYLCVQTLICGYKGLYSCKTLSSYANVSVLYFNKEYKN